MAPSINLKEGPVGITASTVTANLQMQGLERAGVTPFRTQTLVIQPIATSHLFKQLFSIPQYQNQLQGQEEEDTMTADNSGYVMQCHDMCCHIHCSHSSAENVF
jgi:hypothetical protein